MSPSVLRFSAEICSTASRSSTVVLLHWGRSSVDDTTYLGRLSILSAHRRLTRSPIQGARDANHSKLLLPSSSASAFSASSVSLTTHCSRSWPPAHRWNHPPRSKPSWPSGFWTTPSRVTLVLMTILAISVLLWRVVGDPSCRRRDAGKGGAG